MLFFKKKCLNIYVNNNIFFKSKNVDGVSLCMNREINDSFCNLAYFCKNKFQVNLAINYYNKKNMSPAFFAKSKSLKNIATQMGFVEVADQNWWGTSHLKFLELRFKRVSVAGYSLCEASPDDLIDIIKINNLEYIGNGNNVEKIEPTEYSEVLIDAHKNDRVKLFVFQKDNKTFGFATIIIHQNIAYINNLTFLSEYRRTGSFKCLKLLLDWLILNKVKGIFVITQKDGYLDGIYKKLWFKKFYSGSIYSRKPS